MSIQNPMLTPIFIGGEKVVTIVSITLVNATTKQQDVTIPAGERWILLNIKLTNPDDVQRVCTIRHWYEAAKTNLIKLLGYATVGAAGTYNWPNQEAGGIDQCEWWCPIILEAGETLEIEWYTGGASTGGTDADGLVYEYLRYRY